MTWKSPRSRAPGARDDAGTQAWRIRLVGRAAAVLFLAGLFAFLIMGANRPANPTLVPPGGKIAYSGLKSFAAASVIVHAGPGLVPVDHPPCALVASTTAQRNQGLMGQTSLHGFAGMVFEFSTPSQDEFYMRNTPLPLSIAWFNGAGVFLADLDMKPCVARTVCLTYSPGVPYQYALEVPAGRLGSLGVGAGSTIHLGGPCSG